MSWLKAKDWATGVEYSSLFHSGLRAISLRPRARACSSSSSSREKSAGGGTSTASLSSRLLSRSATRTRHASRSVSTSTDPSPAPPPRAPKVARQRPSSMFVRPTKEMVDVCSSGGMFLEIGDYPTFSEEERLLPPIDLDSLAGLRSFFVSLGEMDAIAAMGEESLPDPTPRRPVSMQTMPLPSRHSSRRERGDCAWMLEESSPELKGCELGDEEDDERDWRQFHVDWVHSIH